MAPQYSTRDLVYYGGLFAGVIITHLLLQSMGVNNRIITLVAGLIVGVGLGWLLEKAFTDGDA